ncbi:uncharacterized protein CTHT_0015830 [Thermochaetoides thermophila DSM 1495]|uniref:Defect at low temperature protein 1 n=1 Tax=Chaetomium thermophilum (strain DSM 1495 / CBS 144.50 / IMI 039719) TaxID=759272 RepID=G0S234_CHATD|nr:hypothetical protein CTHT_0015830 [Thermochaetoides thermophila DSM 1495]EGS23094.1 hypothetical protein CTHT_0015830 [Thermochaetoides thermophila DSM 1495]
MAHQTSVLRALSLIIYNFSFYFLYLILFSFLVITPLDLILQASDHHRKADIFVIVLGYAVTVVIITFIYAARLYIHRSVLASIPKGWVPVEKGDVPDEVRDVIAQDLGRSAAIAWEARPRVEHFKEGIRKSAHQQQPSPSMYTPNDDVSQDVNPNPATVTLHPATRPLHQLWAHIQHPGWSPPIPLPSTLDAPATPDPLLRPNLNYETVIAELPALIEAKALTLLSQTSSSSHGDGDGHEHEGVNPAMAAPLLQRPEAMTLREYLGRLVELGVLDSDAVTVTNHPDDGVDEGEDVLTSFLHRWEAARFGPRPVTAAEFKTLMRAFAGVLRAMRGVPAEELLERGFGDDDEDDEEEGVTDYEEDEDQQQGEEQPQEGSDEPEESEGNIDSDAPRGTSVSSDAAERDPQSQRELRNSGTTKSTWSRKFRRRSVSSGSTTFSSSSSVSSMDSEKEAEEEEEEKE